VQLSRCRNRSGNNGEKTHVSNAVVAAAVFVKVGPKTGHEGPERE